MWALVAVLLSTKGVGVQPISVYESMEQCFQVREVYMQRMPQPKVNYEMVCIRTDVFEEV